MARLGEAYSKEILPALKDELSIGNPMAVPKMTKVVLSMGTGSPVVDKNRLEAVTADLALIAGQKPVARRSRKSVSNFKLRTGYEVGCMVTLRGRRMYEFIDRLFNTAIPRVRDFRGLNPKSFDGRGNYSMGVSDQSIFAEVDVATMKYTQGLNVTFVTTARTDAEAKALLTRLGLPLRKTG